MTVAITGASGHIGANLVRALLHNGQPVRCLVHVSCRAIDGLDAERVNGDVRDVESLYRAFQGVDTVYHLAASISLSMADWARIEEINVTGTKNVIAACKRAGVRRLIHFSSIHALTQEPFDIPVDEGRPLATSRNCPPYDRTKAAAEIAVRRAVEEGLDAVIIYPTAVFGPYDFQPSFFGEALLRLAQGRLPALVRGGFDWVDARDVAAGAIEAAAKAPAGGRYLLSGHWVSMCDIAKMIAEITGADTDKFVCPLWLARVGAPFIKIASDIQHTRPLYTSVSLRALDSNHHISHGRAAKELGYQPRPFRQTLEDTLRWFQQNGQLEMPKKPKTGANA
jgi:dihydroflavonol-4-reductase